MSRGLSKKAKVERFDSLQSDFDALSQYAHHLINGDLPDATDEITEEDGEGYINRYVYRAYGFLRANGGVIALIQHIPGQRTSIQVMYFEDWLRVTNLLPYGVGLSTEAKCVAERMSAKRRHIFDAEVQR